MIFKIKCKFWKKCKYYNPNDRTCREDGGQYYGYKSFAGCYRDLENERRLI